MSFYNLLITITWVDFRSDWALCCCRFAFAQIKHLPLTLRFRAEQSFLGASDEPLLLLLTLRFRTDKTFAAATLALRFRTENIRFAAGSRASTMLVTKALSQDVMLLAFVPLPLIPEESPSLYSNQLIHMAYVLAKCHLPLVISRN